MLNVDTSKWLYMGPNSNLTIHNRILIRNRNIELLNQTEHLSVKIDSKKARKLNILLK